MKRIELKLLRDDYLTSDSYFSPTNCPIAVACRRQLKWEDVRVGGTYVRKDGFNISHNIIESTKFAENSIIYRKEAKEHIINNIINIIILEEI